MSAGLLVGGTSNWLSFPRSNLAVVVASRLLSLMGPSRGFTKQCRKCGRYLHISRLLKPKDGGPLVCHGCYRNE